MDMSLFNKIVPDFYQIGDLVIRWIRKKRNLHTGIVDIVFTNLGNHLYSVDCNITYNDGDQPKRRPKFVSTTISNEDVPDHISNSIEDNSLGILKLDEEDLELYNKEIGYKLKSKLSWKELETVWYKDGVSFVNLTDRVFYTLIECYNADEEMMCCNRVGIIEDLPIEISTQLYPLESYRLEL